MIREESFNDPLACVCLLPPGSCSENHVVVYIVCWASSWAASILQPNPASLCQLLLMGFQITRRLECTA